MNQAYSTVKNQYGWDDMKAADFIGWATNPNNVTLDVLAKLFDIQNAPTQEQINAELGERIELFKHEYAHVDGVGGDFFRLTVKKAGQFKNGKLEGTFKEYERDCYNPDIEYVSANYSYHQGLLDGITSLSWLGDRGCDYHTYETIEYTNGFKNGFQKHYQRDIDLYRTYSYIHACTKFKKGKLIEEIHDEETLRKLFPDEFCMEPRRL